MSLKAHGLLAHGLLIGWWYVGCGYLGESNPGARGGGGEIVVSSLREFRSTHPPPRKDIGVAE